MNKFGSLGSYAKSRNQFIKIFGDQYIDKSTKSIIQEANTFFIILALAEVWCVRDNPKVILNRVSYEAINSGVQEFYSLKMKLFVIRGGELRTFRLYTNI